MALLEGSVYVWKSASGDIAVTVRSSVLDPDESVCNTRLYLTLAGRCSNAGWLRSVYDGLT